MNRESLSNDIGPQCLARERRPQQTIGLCGIRSRTNRCFHAAETRCLLDSYAAGLNLSGPRLRLRQSQFCNHVIDFSRVRSTAASDRIYRIRAMQTLPVSTIAQWQAPLIARDFALKTSSNDNRLFWLCYVLACLEF